MTVYQPKHIEAELYTGDNVEDITAWAKGLLVIPGGGLYLVVAGTPLLVEAPCYITRDRETHAATGFTMQADFEKLWEPVGGE